MFLFLPALVFCNSPQLLDAWMWVSEEAVVTLLCCYCSLAFKEELAWLFCEYSMSAAIPQYELLKATDFSYCRYVHF